GSSSSTLSIQNNVLVGQVDWRGNATGNPGELACGHYAYNSSAVLSYSGNAFWNVKSGQCPSGSVCSDPRLTRTAMADFDATPLEGSPLVDKAPYLSAITNDFFKNPRPSGAAADIGAVERQSGGGTPTPSCSRNAPSLALGGSTAAVAAGSTVSYTVTLSNQDSSACASTTFNLARSVPSGWTGTLGKSTLTLAPGASASTTLSVVSPASATQGGYGVGVGIGSANGSIHTRNASTTYNVAAPAATCTRAAPSFSLSGPSGGVAAGSTVRYTLNVTNRDSSACTSTSFNLARSVPGGWTGTLSKSTATLAPGASTSATLDVTSAATAGAGTYSIGAGTGSPVGGIHTANASASYAVQAPQPPPAGELEQSLSTDKGTYRRGDTVRMTSRVLLDGQAAGGANVSFVVTNPYGASETYTATANANGQATASGTLSRWWWWAPSGTYTVRATASRGSVSTTDETTFQVR
ncbi:NEW3 domain-containing protein, partial [Marilutibacter spongiae]